MFNVEPLKESFIGFTIDGVHSSSLGIIRTIDSMMPLATTGFQDVINPKIGADGEIWYNTTYTKKDIPNISIDIHPTIKAESTSTATATVENNISIEIRDLIHDLQGEFNCIKDEIDDGSDEFKRECDKVSKAFAELDNCETKADLKKSGALGKIENFLKKANNKTTKIGKLIDESGCLFDNLKNLCSRLLGIAKWAGIALSPFIQTFAEQIIDKIV